MDQVSIVIPCFNPRAWLLDAVASARAQTYPEIEIVLVNDGTDRQDGRPYLEQARRLVDVYLEQPNRGLPAARNTGWRAAGGRFVVPLDADDLLQPEYVAECMAAVEASPEAAFIYTDCEIFGAQQYVNHLPDYNLYHLLDRNFLTYAALIQKEDWERAGGYDESMRSGYEDWEFWLRLGAGGRFGRRLGRCLFRYRRDGPSLYDNALAHHDELVRYIQTRHPELYQDSARARVKACWSPAVCVLGSCAPDSQSIRDIQFLSSDPGGLLERSSAPAFLLTGPETGSHSAEMAALAVWSGRHSLRLADGSEVRSRQALRQPDKTKPAAGTAKVSHAPERPPFAGMLYRHLVNAQLLDRDAWLRHPWRSALRLVPLRWKEAINKAAGRPVFDLSFYLQFQPRSVVLGNQVVEPLVYFPKPSSGRVRVALITPHLAPGGAENVLLDLAASLSRERFELLLLATQSQDNGWLPRWQRRVEHIYDLAQVVPPDRMAAAIYSVVYNWKCDAVLVQNSLFGYAAVPHIKRHSAQTRTLDLIHSVDPGWDLLACTRESASFIDLRVAVSESLSDRLLAEGTPAGRIRVIRNGVDLERFRPSSPGNIECRQILFVGRLDPVKRPLLLVRIAARLAAQRKERDFRFIVAGAGPESVRLQREISRLGLNALFELRGHVEDVAPLYAAADLIVVTSKSEGIPLAILEALASARPVVASNVGAIAEVVDPDCGVLVDVSRNECDEFAAVLNRLLDRPDVRIAMGAAARTKIEQYYDRRRSIEAYCQLFEDLK